MDGNIFFFTAFVTSNGHGSKPRIRMNIQKRSEIGWRGHPKTIYFALTHSHINICEVPEDLSKCKPPTNISVTLNRPFFHRFCAKAIRVCARKNLGIVAWCGAKSIQRLLIKKEQPPEPEILKMELRFKWSRKTL